MKKVIVFGGGEPLLQSEYIVETVKLFPNAWKVRIETSLNVDWRQIEPLIAFVDQWIIDIKDMNPATYKEYTGHSQRRMIYNLNNLIHRVPAEKILVRVPHIPYYNTREDVVASIRTLRTMGVKRIDEFVYVT